MSRDQWVKKAVEQYVLHGISEDKARMWAESILNNDDYAINKCPYLTAEADYRT